VHEGIEDEEAILRAVITAVSSSLEIDEVLAGVVEIATEATACHACLIYLIEGDRLVLRAASPVHRSLVGRIEMGLDDGVTGWVARHQEPVFIRDDALHDPRIKYFPELEEELFQSMAAVPVCSRAGDVIGVIVLHTAAPREFGEEVLSFLITAASLVGGAIENAQLYEEARRRALALTRLAEVSQRLAAATEHARVYEVATEGARALLGADLCQLFRLESDARELRMIASSPPDAHGPHNPGGAPVLEFLARDRIGATESELWPGHEGAALLTAPLVASGERLGVLCVLGRCPRRFDTGDEELLAALADQTAMSIERAELIARLTARDRVKRFFDILADSSADTAGLCDAPSGCNIERPHVVLIGRAAAGANGSGADWEAVSARLARRLRGWDQATFIDLAPDGLRAVVLLPDAAAAARALDVCDSVAVAEQVVFGMSAPGRGVAGAHHALREAGRAAEIAGALRRDGGALGYEQLGAYKYLMDLRLEESPRDRHWRAAAALLAHDRQQRTALLDTLEEYLARGCSIVDTARSMFIHRNTLRQRLSRVEEVTGLRLDAEDLLALELAVKMVRLQDARGCGGA